MRRRCAFYYDSYGEFSNTPDIGMQENECNEKRVHFHLGRYARVNETNHTVTAIRKDEWKEPVQEVGKDERRTP